MSELVLEHPLLKGHRENPSVPSKSKSGDLIAKFELSKEFREFFKLKYVLYQKITLEKVELVVQNPIFLDSAYIYVKCTKSHPRGECSRYTTELLRCCKCD